MPFDSPETILAISLLVALIFYQIYGKGRGHKRNSMQTLGFVVIALGILVLVLLDFVTAFLFLSVGVAFMMIGEFVSKVSSVGHRR